MSSANTNSNNSTNSASIKKTLSKKFLKKKQVKKPSPPPKSAEEVSTSDEEISSADEVDVIADVASEASNSGNESEASIASEASEASSAESDADTDTLITSDDKNNALVGVKATEGEVAEITTLLGDFTTEGWTKTSDTCLRYRQSIIARAMEVEYFKTAPPKGKSKTKPRAERRLKYGEMELSKTGASAMRSHFLQDDGETFHNDAFKDTIAEYTYNTFAVASATDYGASPSDEFWNKQFLGGYLASEEGKARLTHYQSVAEGFEGSKKKRVKKVSPKDKAQITSALTEDELRELLAKFTSK